MATATRGVAQLEIAATPEHIYGLITDITRMGQWSPECYRCEWLRGARGAVVGARFRGYNRLGPIRWARAAEIVRADPGREFSFTTIDERAGREQTRWRFRMEPSAAGTVLTESYEFVWCPLHERVAEVFLPRDKQLRRGMEQTLRRIKAAAESHAAPGQDG